jgi:hypothetical protein
MVDFVPNLSNRADKPTAQVPVVARKQMFLARGINVCPNFFCQPLLYYEYIYIYIYFYEGVEIMYAYQHYQIML